MVSRAACVVGGLGCGASPAEPSASPDSTALGSVTSSADDASDGAESAHAKQLQGEWEIVRYVSNEAIPPEAMPLLAEMFETLTLRFEGTTVEAGGETVSFRIEDGQADSFILHAKGGMFDGATCRFVEEDKVEVIDEGPQWPGTSLLRRMKK